MVTPVHITPVMGYDPTGYWDWGLFRRVVSSVLVGIPSAIIGFVTGGPVVAVVAVVTSVIVINDLIDDHYDRNEENIDLPETKEDADDEGWNDKVDANCHQFTATEGPNIKYVSPDGHREAIYDNQGRLVTDPRDIGTYNKSPSGTFVGTAGHILFDVAPWILWGNSADDNTNIFERIVAFCGG